MSVKRDWTEMALDSVPDTGLWLWVEDGVCGHATPIDGADMANGDEVGAALADYLAGYDAGDYAGEIEVSWRLLRDGEEEDSGSASKDQ